MAPARSIKESTSKAAAFFNCYRPMLLMLVCDSSVLLENRTRGSAIRARPLRTVTMVQNTCEPLPIDPELARK